MVKHKLVLPWTLRSEYTISKDFEKDVDLSGKEWAKKHEHSQVWIANSLEGSIGHKSSDVKDANEEGFMPNMGS